MILCCWRFPNGSNTSYDRSGKGHIKFPPHTLMVWTYRFLIQGKEVTKPISVHFNRVKPFYQNPQHLPATGCSVPPMFPRQPIGVNPQTILPVPYAQNIPNVTLPATPTTLPSTPAASPSVSTSPHSSLPSNPIQSPSTPHCPVRCTNCISRRPDFYGAVSYEWNYFCFFKQWFMTCSLC